MTGAITLGLLSSEQEQLQVQWQWHAKQQWLSPQWMELIHSDDLPRVQEWLRTRNGVIRCRLYCFVPPTRGWLHISMTAVPIVSTAVLVAARPISFENSYE